MYGVLGLRVAIQKEETTRAKLVGDSGKEVRLPVYLGGTGGAS